MSVDATSTSRAERLTIVQEIGRWLFSRYSQAYGRGLWRGGPVGGIGVVTAFANARAEIVGWRPTELTFLNPATDRSL
jgi:hypothetical protein